MATEVEVCSQIGVDGEFSLLSVFCSELIRSLIVGALFVLGLDIDSAQGRWNGY